MTVNVTPFSDDFGMMPEVPVVHAEVAYDCPITGNSTILIINKAHHYWWQKIMFHLPDVQRIIDD